jgi:hypothetical protein
MPNNHTQSIAGGKPISVPDMFEHAYQMDFGAKASDYVKVAMAAILVQRHSPLREMSHALTIRGRPLLRIDSANIFDSDIC